MANCISRSGRSRRKLKPYLESAQKTDYNPNKTEKNQLLSP